MAGTDSMHEAPHAGVVRIEKSDVHFSCDGLDTITRAGLKAGFGMPYECNAGGCGTCRFELVEGEKLFWKIDLYERELVKRQSTENNLTIDRRHRSGYLGELARQTPAFTVKECTASDVPCRFTSSTGCSNAMVFGARQFF